MKTFYQDAQLEIKDLKSCIDDLKVTALKLEKENTRLSRRDTSKTGLTTAQEYEQYIKDMQVCLKKDRVATTSQFSLSVVTTRYKRRSVVNSVTC